MTAEPRLVVRVDANDRSGFGHLSRCLNLSRHFLSLTNYHSSHILFVGNFTAFAQAVLSSYKLNFLSTTTESELGQVLARESKRGSAILIDSYRIDQEMLDELCHFFSSTIIIDDTCRLQYTEVDLLINFRYSAERLFSPNAKDNALGVSYFVTRPELTSLRNRNTTVKPEVNKMMIFMGGGYSNFDTIQKVVDVSKQLQPNIEIVCVSNQSTIKAVRGVRYVEPTMEVEVLLDDCDICVNGGGLIKYECVFSKVPSASLSTTELQYEDSAILAEAGLVQNLGMDGLAENAYLQDCLDDILNNHELRKSLVEAGTNLFNSHSAENLVRKIQAVI